ncbi:adenylosuccinate lyase [Candidatus Saccharibacteria bacterium RIFCSPHIGHO2_12_FULL_47_17]|nr:MAG: adenylosuccinate lyase [Candidatus Saccharibacteria bacterium RIFCSPHIGHO2_12_FULL_47_17]
MSLKAFKLPTVSDKPFHDGIDPLDNRYYDPEIAKYLSERATIAYKAYCEAALAHTLADFKICSTADAAKIEAAAARVTAEEVAQEEKTTKHDIKALVNVIKKYAGEDAGRYVHFGATSYDIVSTATSLQFKTAANELIVPRAKELLKTLVELTERYADTPQIGRTHGQHALPITFGFAMSEYVSRIGNSMMAVQDLAGQLKGKFSGAVGAYNALSAFTDDPLAFEKKFLEKLGLEPSESSTQIVPPEYMVRLLDELAIMAAIMANLATDMRHLQRSEIAEIREKFETGQTGSSTMAHKRNPINFENVVSMHKQVLSQILNANLNLISEHQRDLTDSASARFYAVPVATVAVMLSRLNSAMLKVEVDEANMQRNLAMSGGAIAAEPLYLLLAKYGHASAHEKSKALAHQALDSNKSLVEVIAADSEAKSYWDKFSTQEKQIITEPQKYYLGLASEKAKNIASNWR